LQIKFEDGCYRPIFRRAMPLEGFYSFPDFFFTMTIFCSFDIHVLELKGQSQSELNVHFMCILKLKIHYLNSLWTAIIHMSSEWNSRQITLTKLIQGHYVNVKVTQSTYTLYINQSVKSISTVNDLIDLNCSCLAFIKSFII
jgi:hypothetical protein